jgi:hypothetical protein
MKRRPQPTQAQSMGHVLTDSALCELLLAKAPLTQSQTEAFVGYATQLAAGTLPRLPKTVRDHAIAVAKASGLLQRTEMRRHPHAGHVNLGDGLSTVPGPVDARAAAQFGNIPKPIRRAG